MEEEPAAGDEFDSPAEVDAAFRTQRRIAVGYFVVFICGVVLIPVGTVAAEWWPGGRLSSWATGFVVAGAGLYVFFFVLGLSAASLANGVERRMLGAQRDEAPAPGHDFT